MPEFIHLHNHSHFSLLDGAATIDGLVQAAVENKMPPVALTDHGVMFGAIEFYKTARKAGVKPIIGCEVYIVPRHPIRQGGERAEREGGEGARDLPPPGSAGEESHRLSQSDQARQPRIHGRLLL